MMRKVLAGALLWTLFITLGHVQLNVGWARLVEELRIAFGEERQELVVGFLPVT